MKHKHILALGLALGLCLGSSLQTFGLAAVENITAQINRQYRFDFDGERVTLPAGYEVLVYQDRTYVPARFVAEQLGAEVLWDEETKLISINQSVDDNQEEKEEEPVPEEEKKPTIAYQSLPAYTETIDVKIIVLFDVDYKEGKRIHLSVENKTTEPMTMEATNVKAIVDGKEVDLLKASPDDRDYSWYEGTTMEDEKKEGYILIPASVKDPQEITLELPIRFDGNRQTTVTVPIHFTL